MTRQLQTPLAGTAHQRGPVAVLTAGRAAGPEMPQLLLRILAATLNGEDSHVQAP